jgi:hypothetical protein
VKLNLQEKLESGPIGRAVISGALLFILGALVAANIPPSYVQQKLNTVVRPVRDGVGLDQTWSVFAPEPRSQTFGLEARISYSDGSSEVWHVPTGDPFVAEYRTYHWQKWSEFARQDERPYLWGPFALWVARTHIYPDARPTSVTLVRTWIDLLPPGAGILQGPRHEYPYFTLQVTPEMLVRRS